MVIWCNDLSSSYAVNRVLDAGVCSRAHGTYGGGGRRRTQKKKTKMPLAVARVFFFFARNRTSRVLRVFQPPRGALTRAVLLHASLESPLLLGAEHSLLALVKTHLLAARVAGTPHPQQNSFKCTEGENIFYSPNSIASRTIPFYRYTHNKTRSVGEVHHVT